MHEFREAQGKDSSSGAPQREMAWHDVKLTFAGDKWEMGWGTMYLGWAGWLAESAHGICTHFPFFCCPARKK